MDELPYMKYFPSDFLGDCAVLSVSARGAWHSFLCTAWLARSASATYQLAQWARIFGASSAKEASVLIAEIEDCEVGDIIRADSGKITLVSRRIERDLLKMGASKKRKSDAARKAAQARWDAERMRNACETHAECNADAMRGDAIPEARSQKPEPEEEGELTLSCPIPDETPVFLLLWKAAPKQARERSSKKQTQAAWNRIPAGVRPSATLALEALDAWSKSHSWTKHDGDFIPGLHRWISNLQWENVPNSKQPPVQNLGHRQFHITSAADL